MDAALHIAADLFRPGPKCRRQPAFSRQRSYEAALRGLGEQAQRAIEARLAAAIRPGHDIEPAERDDEIAQGAVVGDGERGEHRGIVETAVVFGEFLRSLAYR